MKRSILKNIFVTSLMLVAVSAFSANTLYAASHPADGYETKFCSRCHDDWRATLEHSSDYSKRHRYFSAQRIQVCGGCHKESFCADCHADKEEIKAVDKFKDSPDRFFPHRGDYINRHKIDGRINPAACFKCHGRKNNARCKTCHRK